MATPLVEEADLALARITVEADPVFAGRGIFDMTLFDIPIFDTGEVSIDDDPLPVAIMVEAEP